MPAALEPAPVNAASDPARPWRRFWLKLMMWHAQRAPWVLTAARPLALACAWRFSRPLRSATLANAAHALGGSPPLDQCRAVARAQIGAHYDFVRDLAASARRPDRPLADRITRVEGHEAYAKVRAAGRGAVLVTAHLGSFELGMAALSAHESRVHVVFKRDEFDAFERLRSAQRRRLGVEEAPIDDGLAVWMRVRDALARDEVVLMQGDRVMPGQRGVPVRFLDRIVPMPSGPVRLALLTGAPLVPVFTVLAPGARGTAPEASIHIEAPIDLTLPAGNGDACDGAESAGGDAPPRGIGGGPRANDLAVLVQRTTDVIERFVRAYPDQWLMLEPVPGTVP